MASITGQLNSIYVLGYWEHCAFDDPFNVRSDFSPKVLVFNFFTGTFGRGGIGFWQFTLVHLNGCRIWFKSSGVRVAFSVASDTGYRGYIVELGPQVATQSD